MPSRPSLPRRHTPALVASAASVLLASGVAVSLAAAMRSFERELDSELDSIDIDQTAVAVWWAGDVALRWAFISAAGSVCGVLGLVFRKSKLHGVFALTTAFDLLATIFLTLTLLLLTFSPSLSEPFGEFICSSSYASDFSDTARSLLARPTEHAALSWTNGIELAFWGVETCEDAWQSAMLRILVGCAVTIGLRAYGTWVTWDANVDLRETELRDRGLGSWIPPPGAPEAEAVCGDERGANDTKGMVEKVVRRLSSSGGARPVARYTPLALEEARAPHSFAAAPSRRSNTFPLAERPEEKRRPARAQSTRSSSSSHRSSSASSSPSRRSSAEPRLVLVPFVIDTYGHAVYEPSSPTLHMPSPQGPSTAAATVSPRRLSSLSSRPPPPRPHPRTARGRSLSSSSSCSVSPCPSLAGSSTPTSPTYSTSPSTPPLVLYDEPSRMSTSPARCQSNSTKALDTAANRTGWTRDTVET
ncbi:hypothetical protein JCM3774_004349 [Rhodotorula dairenensis]